MMRSAQIAGLRRLEESPPRKTKLVLSVEVVQLLNLSLEKTSSAIFTPPKHGKGNPRKNGTRRPRRNSLYYRPSRSYTLYNGSSPHQRTGVTLCLGDHYIRWPTIVTRFRALCVSHHTRILVGYACSTPS